MSDHGELKRLALACGNLNWQFLTVKFTEYGIRDDHGYIAFLPVGHPAKYGACPEREAKARFLGAMTPAAVLGLLAEIERMREDACFRAVKSLRGDCKDLMAERDQLKTENEQLAQVILRKREDIARLDQAFLTVAAQRDRLKTENEALRGLDDIPDFGGGSGNKARRKAEALGIDYDSAMGKGELS